MANTLRTRAGHLMRAALRGQDFGRRQARRFARGATNKIRVGHQSQDGQADRPDDSAECAGESGSGDQITIASGQ
jgi:hypothetical protein